METLQSNFADGMKAGLKPSKERTAKAISVVVSKKSNPYDRAYWTGYLCQAQENDSSFMESV